MNCPYCSAINDNQNSFCVSCGKTITRNIGTQDNLPPPTLYVRPPDPAPSVDTAYPPQPPPSAFRPEPPLFISQPAPPPQRSWGLILAAFGIGAVMIAAAGIGGFFIWKNQPSATEEVLPDHLGLFVQNKDGKSVAEIKKTDVVNALDQKMKVLDDDGLPVWEKDSGLILYADAKDVPPTDLKLIPISTIADDGKFKQIEFQAAPVEGKPEMKRLRLPDSIADGKYAFAILEGFLDDGKHKFWAFQVKGIGRAENTENVKDASVSLKNPAASTDKKDEAKVITKDVTSPPVIIKETKVEPPLGARVAYCNGNNVLMRASPSLQGQKIGSLKRGQRLYVVQYSDNYDNWRGTTANWAYVQTEAGKRGWVFTPFVNY